MVKVDSLRAERLDANVEAQLQHEKVIEVARKGSIWDLRKVFESAGISKAEVQKFFGKQYRILQSEVIKPASPYVSEAGMIPEPSEFCASSGYEPPPSQTGASISDEEAKEFSNSLAKAMAKSIGKAMRGPKAADSGEIEDTGEAATATEEATSEIDSIAEEYLAEYNDFMEDFNLRIMDQQMILDATKESDDAKRELMRIVNMARRGEVDAAYVLVALAKFSAAKNGAIFSSLSKKVYSMNDQMNKINETLYGSDTDAMTQLTRQQEAQGKTRDLQFQQTQLMQSMEKVTNNIKTTFEFASQTISLIYRTRRQMQANQKA